jgi:hypothetical protein
MVKTKTFSVIVKILIHNRVLGLNFAYKTYHKNLLSIGHKLRKSSIFFPKSLQRLISPIYKEHKKKRLSF